MSDLGNICVFQALKFPYRDQPAKLLEEDFVPASQCSLSVAKMMLMQRFEGGQYLRTHNALWPDLVRFLDQDGHEVLRYTMWNYLREITTREAVDARAS